MSLRSVLLGFALVGLSCPPSVGSAETLFKGTLGGMPITMFQAHRNGVNFGVYFYDRYRTPIRLKPSISNLERYYHVFDELDSQGLPVARLRVQESLMTEKVGPNQFTQRKRGFWQDYRTGKQLEIKLKVEGNLSVDRGPSVPVIQAASTKDHYFQVPMTSHVGKVNAVEVMSKKTGLLVQTLAIPGCFYEGIDTVQVVVEQGVERVKVGQKVYCQSPSFAWDTSASEYRVN